MGLPIKGSMFDRGCLRMVCGYLGIMSGLVRRPLSKSSILSGISALLQIIRLLPILLVKPKVVFSLEIFLRHGAEMSDKIGEVHHKECLFPIGTYRSGAKHSRAELFLTL
jgi:hypothetical protein